MFLFTFFPQNLAAEKLFDEMLVSMERMTHIQIEMSQLSRGRRDEAYSVGPSWMIQLDSRKRFAIQASDMWGGDSGTHICDGKTLLVKGDSTVLRDPVSVGEIGTNLAAGGYGSVLFELLKGRTILDTFFGPEHKVATTRHGLTVWSRNFGVLDIDLKRESGLLLPTRIVVSDKASKMARYLMLPMFSEKPEDPSDMFSLRYNFVESFPRGTFDTRVKKGLPFIDQRKKKP